MNDILKTYKTIEISPPIDEVVYFAVMVEEDPLGFSKKLIKWS
jgi:hypothetical protein